MTGFYTGWSSFNPLLVQKHGLVSTRSNPKLCSLTTKVGVLGIVFRGYLPFQLGLGRFSCLADRGRCCHCDFHILQGLMLAARLHAAAVSQGKVDPLDTSAASRNMLPAGAEVVVQRETREVDRVVHAELLSELDASTSQLQHPDELAEPLAVRLAKRAHFQDTNGGKHLAMDHKRGEGRTTEDVERNFAVSNSSSQSLESADEGELRDPGTSTTASQSLSQHLLQDAVEPYRPDDLGATTNDLPLLPRLPPLAPGQRFGDAYDIIFLVDAREQFSRGAGENRGQSLTGHLEVLRRQGVLVEERTIPVGDALWIARSK